MIKAIVFDIGGVIVTDALRRMAKDLSEKHNLSFELLDREIHREWTKYKLDEITVDKFWGNFIERTGIPESVEELKKIALAEIKIIPGTIGVIKKLKKNYRLAIVSNCTHEWAARDKELFDFGLFEVVVFSQETGLCKPHKEIFMHCLEKMGLKADECVFVDNKGNNVDAAKEYGFQAVQFEDAFHLEQELKNLGVEL